MIPADHLEIGLFVDLELGWSRHPFAFTRFMIRSEEQIDIIRRLIPGKVKIYPSRCAEYVLISQIGESYDPTEPPARALRDVEIDSLLAEKLVLKERAAAMKVRRREMIREYHEKTRQIKDITNDMKQRPANAIHNIDALVEDLSSIFDGEDNLLTKLVDLNSNEYTDFNHTTNVTMLSLMLGKAVGIAGESLKVLATGALLHDIGKIDVPAAIKLKTTELTSAEQAIFRKHPAAGRNLVDRVRTMHREITNIIEQHHEFLDGSGYPNNLRANQLSKMVRLVAITNLYDNLCNPPDVNAAMTPKNALAILYKHYEGRLDATLVARLIEILGVYPPGTVVQLNDEQLGLVISAKPGGKLKPDVLIYDPSVPKQQALIVCLSDFNDIEIVKALRPGEYPREIHDYFGIQDRIGYMVESQTG